MKQRSLLPRCLLALFLAGSAPVSAATIDVPSPANPANVPERLHQQAPAPKRSGPVFESPKAAAIRPEAASQLFVLGKVIIEGMTAYPAGTFDDLYKDRIGQKVSVAEIQQMAAAITQRYQADGYVLAVAFVPTQTVGEDGAIVIRVNEGRIANVQFLGTKPTDAPSARVVKYVEKIKSQHPLKVEALERYLLLINDLPGNSARAILRPSAGEPGNSDMIVYLGHKAIEASLSTDNRGSRYVGPWQTAATVSENAQAGLDERVTVRGIVTSYSRELRFGDVQYEQPVGSEGTRLYFLGSYAKSEPGDSIAVLDIRGKTASAQAKATHPFVRSRLENLTARATFDLRNSDTDILSLPQSYDRVRSLRGGVSYDIADSFNGVNLLDMEISQGLSLGATNDGAGRTRIRGKHDYTKITADVSRTQALPRDFSLFVAGSGQYAFDPLLSSEQFLIGGQSFGGAYDPGELAGDHGVAGKAELRYGQLVGAHGLNSYQLYGYYDVGSIWRRLPLASEKDRESLASLGLGARLNFNESLSGSVEVAFPQTRKLAADRDNDSRIFGSLTARY